MNKILFRSIFFFLCVVFLSGCRQEDEADNGNEPGEPVAVTVPLEGGKFESVAPVSTRGSSSPESFTVTEDLGDGFIMETSLVPVTPVVTRASRAAGLANDVRILVIAYRESGELYKYQQITPASPQVYLPQGERFKLLFYSYNDSSGPDISGDYGDVSVASGKRGYLFGKGASLTNRKKEERSRNVMWAKIDLTPKITSGTTLESITFTPLFSRLDWRLLSVVGPITECSGGIRGTYEYGNIKLGNLINLRSGDNGTETWSGAGSANYTAPVRFAEAGGTDITSSKTMFCPNVGQSLVLGLESITVGGKTFRDKSYTFSRRLRSGVDYRAESTIKRRLTVTFMAGKGGSVSPAGEQTANAYGDRLSASATVDTGWKFKGWYQKRESGDILVSTDNRNIIVNGLNLTVIMNGSTENNTYEARFSKNGLEWASGNLQYRDGKYIFCNEIGKCGNWYHMFWMRGSEVPEGKETAPGTLGVDPCKRVDIDGGGWRTPTVSEIRKLRFTGWSGSYMTAIYEEGDGQKISFPWGRQIGYWGYWYQSVDYAAIRDDGQAHVRVRIFPEIKENIQWSAGSKIGYPYNGLVGLYNIKSPIRCVREKK